MTKYSEILQRIKHRDETVIAVLYETYGKKFYSYCGRNWNCDEVGAWEMVYRTLEALVLKLGLYSFDSQEKFDAFLFTVLANNVRQEFRSARVRNGVQLSVTDFNDESLPKEIDDQITVGALN